MGFTLRCIKAPNGKTTKLNEEQWVTVRTEAFKNWFGDWEVEHYLKNLVNDKNVIDYERLEKIYKYSTSNGARIGSLNGKEEQGRNGGGRAHVEASAIVGAKARTTGAYQSTNQSYKEHKEQVKDQEDLLESYAKEKGIWFDYSKFKEEFEYLDRGVESEVYRDKDSDKTIVKLMGYDFQKQQSPQDYLDRLALHNYLFPSTKYELIGFTKDDRGFFKFVTRQQFIEGEIVSVDDRIKYMQKIFKAVPTDEEKINFMNSYYNIRDLHEGNLYQKDGQIYVFDPIIELNLKADNQGGEREKLDPRYMTSKVIDENGEPLVVYHGTNANFTEFKNPYYTNRYFFTHDKKLSSSYGKNNMEVFLNIKNPLETKENIEYANTFNNNNLVNDGVIYNSETEKGEPINSIISFYPNQIKSATDNIGSFSSESNNILYQQINAQYRIENGKNLIEAIQNFDGSPKAVTAITHEIMHPTVVAILDGAAEGNETAQRHTKTIIEEYNKANQDSKVTQEQMIADNEQFKQGNTTSAYRAVQEFIAESWEQYHTEGAKGFSKAFQEVLEQITKAFRAVYNGLTGKQLTPELRQMFDEILGKPSSSKVEDIGGAPKELSSVEETDKALDEVTQEQMLADNEQFQQGKPVNVLNSDNQSDTIGETDKQAPKEDQEAKSQADGVLNYKSGHIWFQDNDTEIFTDIQYDQYNNSSEELTYSKKCK